MTDPVNAELSLGIFAIAYVFIASEKVEKTTAALLGAAAVVTLGLIPYEAALAAIDLNVIFLLVGMMVIVNVMAKTGIFEWVAITIAKWARGNGMAIVVAFLVATMLLSALLDNVTTIILIAPITILICEILSLPVALLLILEAIASNIGGTSTLIGDPPNVIIASQAGLEFNDFIVHMAPAVGLITIFLIPVLWLGLGRKMHVEPAARRRVMRAEPSLAILDRRALIASLIVFAGVLAAFLLGHAFHLEPGLIALTGAVVMVLVCKDDLHTVLTEVEWSTILFFIGLFMLIGALTHNGLFELLGRQILVWTGGDLLITVLAILWIAALGSAIVDNIPLVIAMVPLIQSIVPEFGHHAGYAPGSEELKLMVAEPLYWALALGACLGGNGSLVGASANVVVSQIARRNDHQISFMAFTRVGFPVMLLTLAISSVYLYVRYFALRAG